MKDKSFATAVRVSKEAIATIILWQNSKNIQAKSIGAALANTLEAVALQLQVQGTRKPSAEEAATIIKEYNKQNSIDVLSASLIQTQASKSAILDMLKEEGGEIQNEDQSDKS